MSDQPSKNQPEGFEEHKPSGKKGKGPSMKERLIAQRKAEAEAAAQPKAAPAKPKAPAPKPAVKRTAAPKKAAPKAAAASDSESGGEEAPARPARAQRASRGGASRRSGARGSSRRRGGDDGDEGEGEERGGRRRPAKKEKNMLVPALGTLAVVAIAGIGAWQFMGGDDADAATKPDPQDATMSAAGDQDDQAMADKAAMEKEAAEKQAAADKAAMEKEAADKEKEASKPKPVATEDLTEAPRRRDGRQKLLVKAPDNIYDPNDPKEPNLKEMEKFAKPDNLSDEDWATINEKVATMLDPDAGAAGTRAATYLEKIGRDAFPAMVNGLLDLDYGTEDGNLNGDFVQRTMMNIANGRNFSWAYGFGESPNKTEIANKRAVALAYGVWQKVVDDPSYWERYSNTEAARRNNAGGGGAAAAPEESADDGADDLMDDLGLDD